MHGLILICVAAVLSTGCVRVAPYERGYLTEATMRPVVDPLEASAASQLHRAREAAAGGIMSPVGGGCGCTN